MDAASRATVFADLPFVVELAKKGTLAGAARALGVDPTTVGRRVASLERALGGPLFRAEGARRVPTPLGASLVEAGDAIDRRLDEARHSAEREREQPEGVVRITSTELLASSIVAPALPRLLSRFPLLSIDLVATQARLDLARGEADLALRFSRPEESGVTRRRLSTLPSSAWAAEGHLALARGSRRTLDVGRLARVTYGDGGRAETEWLDRVLPCSRTALRTTSVGSALEAVAAGVGVGVLPDRLAAGRGLVRVDALGAPPQRTLWLALQPAASRTARVRAVAEWLTDAVRA